MDWTQALSIIGSILVPMLAGFGWLIHLILETKKELQSEIKQTHIEIKQMDLRLSQDVRQIDNRLSRIEGYLQGRDVHLSNTDKTS